MSELVPVAALYVDPRGPYPALVQEWLVSLALQARQ